MFSTKAGRPPAQRKRISQYKTAFKPLNKRSMNDNKQSSNVEQPSQPTLLKISTAKKSLRSSHTSSQQSNELGKTILTAFTDLLKKEKSSCK